MNMKSKIALVTGASSGIGQATAQRLANAGYKVYGTSRRGGRAGQRLFEMLPLDVTLCNLTKEGQEYVGGQILDPDNGNVYRSNVRLTDNGKKLSVRGYIGVPMLGRSQTWVPQE